VRIVSLLPSATEIVCALGLQDQLVGVSHECDYPAAVQRLPKVTSALVSSAASSGEIDRQVRERLQAAQSLYVLDVPLLVSLRPDLIVTQTLCNVCAVGEDAVRRAMRDLGGGAEVVTLEPQSLADVFASIEQVAEAAGVPQRARELVGALKARVEAVRERAASCGRPLPRTALLEWLDPPFSSGHWNPELVRLAGGVEGLGREGQPSRTLSWDEVHAWQPEVVLIACCGFTAQRAFQEADCLCSVDKWNDLPAVKNGRVYVTDGSQYFNRPGPRLVDSLEILAHILNPADVPLPAYLPQPLRLNLRGSGVSN
jgi:iron complex transport system substrate-binding protein